MTQLDDTIDSLNDQLVGYAGIDLDPRGANRVWWILVAGERIGWVRRSALRHAGRGDFHAVVQHRCRTRRCRLHRDYAHRWFDDFDTAVIFVVENAEAARGA